VITIDIPIKYEPCFCKKCGERMGWMNTEFQDEFVGICDECLSEDIEKRKTKQTTKVSVQSVLSCEAFVEISLPISSWYDIQSWYIKSDVLYYTLDGKNWDETPLNSPKDTTNWLRPKIARVFDIETDKLLDIKVL